MLQRKIIGNAHLEISASMTPLALKHLHVTFVVLSLAGFLLRGAWMLADSPRLRARWVRIAPHVVDTGLLLSALALVFMTHQYPGAQNWLTAKVIALFVYIGLGVVALHPGRPKAVRAAAWLAALSVFAYIVSVAVTRDPRGFFPTF